MLCFKEQDYLRYTVFSWKGTSGVEKYILHPKNINRTERYVNIDSFERVVLFTSHIQVQDLLIKDPVSVAREKAAFDSCL